MTSPIAGEREAKEREAFVAWRANHINTVAGLHPTAWEAWQARAALLEPVGEGDARDAARWRRLVNASEMPFPVATIADDPENDCNLIYGRTGLERLIDSCDEISDSYAASPKSNGGMGS